ncbi:MAG: hypothetical protein EHM79_02110 [Geobacter sp.]|nr:MAG: hypothetical protein EHM79_02110 [Geobacter sp.]
MDGFIRILIDADPERSIHFKVCYELGANNSVTVEFKKGRAECAGLTMSDLENLGRTAAKFLLQSALDLRPVAKE